MGNDVEIRHPDTGRIMEGVINKMFDTSMYTVGKSLHDLKMVEWTFASCYFTKPKRKSIRAVEILLLMSTCPGTSKLEISLVPSQQYLSTKATTKY